MGTLGIIVVPDDFDAATPVAGLAPLLRHALSLQAAGAAEVVIVGNAAAPVSPKLTVPARSVARGELPGAMAASPTSAPQRAIVLRADVTCHRLLPTRLAQAALAEGEAVIAGDGSVAPSCAVGASARALDLVDSIASGNADTLKARHLPLDPREFILPAATAADRRAAMWPHLNSLRKPTQGILDRYLMRAVSLRMTKLLVGTWVTPNHVTIFCGSLALVAAYFVTLPGRGMLVVGGALHVLVRIVDCVDGEIARLRYEGTKFGEWLDTVVDMFGVAALLAAAAWRITQADPAWMPIGIFAVAGWLVAHALLFRAMASVGAGTGQALGWSYREAPKSLVDRVVRRFEFLFQIDMISTVFAALIALNRIDVLLVIQSVLAVVTTTYFGIQLAKKPLKERSNRPR